MSGQPCFVIHVEHVVFLGIELKRSEEYGGDLLFTSYDELEKSFAEKVCYSTVVHAFFLCGLL